MVSALHPARVLVDPVDSVPATIEGKRWGLALVALMVAVSAGAVAWYFRWDASAQVIRDLGPELMRSTETEIAEKIATAERLALVKGVARGLLAMPVLVLLLGTFLKFVGWLFGTPTPFNKAFTVAAVGLLPVALFHAVFTIVVLLQHSVDASLREVLVPSHLGAWITSAGPKWGRVLAAIDFFNLWSAVLIGLGFAEASGMRKRRAVALGILLYVLYAGVFLIGLPGMSGGPGGPGRGM